MLHDWVAFRCATQHGQPDGFTPPVIVERLVSAFKKAVESAAFRDYADRGGLLVRYLGPQELAERLRTDAKRNRQVVEEFGWAKKK